MEVRYKQKVQVCCRNVLKAHKISPGNINFDSYAEDKTCIEKSKLGYIVYYGHNGQKVGKTKHLTLTGAALSAVKMYAKSSQEEQDMTEMFEATMKFYLL